MENQTLDSLLEEAMALAAEQGQHRVVALLEQAQQLNDADVASREKQEDVRQNPEAYVEELERRQADQETEERAQRGIADILGPLTMPPGAKP